MAMTLPIAIPSTPTSGNSPASDDSNPPRTPVSPTISPLPDQSTTNSNNNNNSQMKRKPSRRANTAERRATHNAVERQRRETLNGRFLDLAALLPNLSQIRRPSKSSIVNSSIAHVHASRRHRQLAARELRLVKVEADALRRELNEWRDRAGLPRVEEPLRSEGFSMVLSGELEVLAAVPGDEDDEDNVPGYATYDDIDDDFNNSSNPEVDDPRVAAAKNPFAHNPPPPGLHLAHILPRPTQGPMIASPTSVSFENPAMHSLYEPHQQFPPNPHFQQPLSMGQPDADKIAAWNAAHMYPGATTQQILHAQRSLFTPPSTSHGLSSANNANFNDPAGQAFFANFQRQQQQQQQLSAMHHQMGAATHYGSDRDDASSVGSGRGGRARSGSGSGYGGSPQHGSSPYEMPPSGDYNSNIRRASWEDMGGLMKSNQIPPPISVGGGGNGTGFQMMM